LWAVSSSSPEWHEPATLLLTMPLLLTLLLLLQVIEDVDKDRRYAIDAAIVRTMKSRKVGAAAVKLQAPVLQTICVVRKESCNC
jgi:hypothetical protein